MQSGGGDGESYFSYFDSYKPNIAFLRSFWEALIGFLPDALHKYNVLLCAILMLCGYVFGFQKYKRSTIGLGVFFIGFLTMHIAWPMPNFDYQILVVWNALLVFGLGVAWLAQKKLFSTTLSNALQNKGAVVVSGVFLAAVIVTLFRLPLSFPQYRVSIGQWLFIAAPAVLVLFAIFSKAGKIKTGPVLAILLILSPVLFSMLSDANALFYSIRYSKAEFRSAGEWFKENSAAADKLAIEQPVVVEYYSQLNADSFVHLVDLPKVDADSLHSWCIENGVTHIAWLTANSLFETDNAWYQWKMDNRGWKTISFLADGKDSHGFTFIENISIGPRRAFIYKI